MGFRSFCFFLALTAIAATGAQAEEAPASCTAGKIISGHEIALTDGRILSLEGIESPLAETPQWRDRSKQALQDIADGHNLVLDDIATDRYGRISAQAYALDGKGEKIWLQGEMLKRGLAFVYPPTGLEARLDDMRALEAAAQRAKTGLWGDTFYADTPADEAAAKEGHFAFVSGSVLDAARVRSMVYLHFGQNWRTNLTLAIAAHDLRAFRKAGIDPLDLKGKTIRARGWVIHDIGPMIVVTAPGQIEILPAR